MLYAATFLPAKEFSLPRPWRDGALRVDQYLLATVLTHWGRSGYPRSNFEAAPAYNCWSDTAFAISCWDTRPKDDLLPNATP